MSTIQTNAIIDASGGNTTTVNGHNITSSNMMGRNLIINGDMQIAQRGTSSNGITAIGYYTADRHKFEMGSQGNITMNTDLPADAPVGFEKSLRYTVATPDGSSSGSTYYLRHAYHIEGQDLAHLAYGSANAKTITLVEEK